MYTGTKEPTSRTFVTDSRVQENEHSQEELLLLRKAPNKKPRPGMETKSIRKSQSDMNLENAMVTQRIKPGTLICYRCGKKDHLLKNCPIPYQPTLSFAPKKDSVVRTTLLMGEEEEEEGSVGQPIVELQTDIPTLVQEDTQGQSPDLLTMPNLLPEEEEPLDDWNEDLRVASWISPTTQSILVCESYIDDIYRTLTETESTNSSSMSIIIDSGASSTVWITMG